MSSVQSFLKQRNAGSSVFATTAVGNLYVLIAGSGNIVGNYANTVGYMVLASTAGAAPTGTSAPYIRDMGKTVQAPVTAAPGTLPVSGAALGFFRQVQVLDAGFTSSQATFGVQGQIPGTYNANNPGDKGFNTFYVPVAVGGVYPVNAAGTYLGLSDVACVLGDGL